MRPLDWLGSLYTNAHTTNPTNIGSAAMMIELGYDELILVPFKK